MPENTTENDNAASEAADDQSANAAAEGAQNQPDELELAKRRQAGADKARDTAIAERNALQARLDELTTAKPTDKKSDGDGTVDVEALKRELQADFDKRLAETVAAERGKALDAQFPEARKRFPEVTDAAKLVELETLFGETPKPVGNNAARTTGQKNIDDMSIAELRKSLDSQLAGVLDRS